MIAITCSCGHDARNHSPVGCQILINEVVCPCRRSSAEIAIERVEVLEDKNTHMAKLIEALQSSRRRWKHNYRTAVIHANRVLDKYNALLKMIANREIQKQKVNGK